MGEEAATKLLLRAEIRQYAMKSVNHFGGSTVYSSKLAAL